jgi:hypothetical protein
VVTPAAPAAAEGCRGSGAMGEARAVSGGMRGLQVAKAVMVVMVAVEVTTVAVREVARVVMVVLVVVMVVEVTTVAVREVCGGAMTEVATVAHGGSSRRSCTQPRLRTHSSALVQNRGTYLSRVVNMCVSMHPAGGWMAAVAARLAAMEVGENRCNSRGSRTYGWYSWCRSTNS